MLSITLFYAASVPDGEINNRPRNGKLSCYALLIHEL